MASNAPKVAWRSADDSEDDDLYGYGADGIKVAIKTALLLVIDSSPDMFQEQWGENEDSPFRAALKYCVTTCRSKIVSTPRDLVGIMFAGTEKERNPPAFPNFYILHSLAQLKVEVIEELNKMASEEDYDAFEERIGSSSDHTLKDMFWLCKTVFEKAKTGAVNQKLIYLTCEDNPHARNRNLRNDSIQKFKDFGSFVDFNIVTFKSDFMHDRFYKNLFQEPSRITYLEDLKSILQVVRLRQKIHRPLSRIWMEIYKGINIAVGVYSFARTAYPPKKVFVNERTNELATKTINTFRSDSGTTVLKSEQVKVANVMGEMIQLDKDELQVSKATVSATPGITVLGYLPREKFDEFLTYRKEGFFLYPDEERIAGSTDVFTLLLKRCHALQKVAIVKMILTRGRSAKLACLIPSVVGTTTSNRPIPGSRKHPCSGFYVCLLPFADELRTRDLPPGRDASEDLTNLMEKIIRKISRKEFDISVVQNPALQLKYRQIESLALPADSNVFEELPFEDYTESNDDLMENRIGSICEEVNTVVETEHIQTAAVQVRKATTAKPINMAMEAKHKRLDKLTCAVLTDFLSSVGISAQRKTKAKLIEMVYAHFEDD